MKIGRTPTRAALVVVPVVPWNHLIFEKGAMEPLDFGDLVQRNQLIFKHGYGGTTKLKLIEPALYLII